MKNKKFSWLLNIATICLCVCAIAIGVYSAKKASLSITGSISFSAPDCIVEVSGSYTACLTETDTTRTKKDFTTTTVGDESDTGEPLSITDTLCFGSLATDDNGDEIDFDITIKNMSPYRITVKAPAPTLKDSDEQDIEGVTCTSSKEKFTLQAKGQDGSSLAIQLKYKLENIDSAEEFKDAKFNISLNFAKWSALDEMYISSIGEYNYNGYSYTYSYSTTNSLCITMGHSVVGETDSTDGTDGTTETPIQWYAFAVKGVDTGKGYVYNNTWYDHNNDVDTESKIEDRWYSLNGIEFTEDLKMKIYGAMGQCDEISVKGKTFWFIQQYVTAGGYSHSIGSMSVNGIKFDSDGSSNNYQESDIYTYLTGGNEENNYLTDTGIKNESIYSGISKRTVSEDYNIGTGRNYTCSFTSKLWLISLAELGLINNYDCITNPNDTTKTAGICGEKFTETNNSAQAANWWLRSAVSSSEQYVNFVNTSGSAAESGAPGLTYGVRAAFEISIPA